MNEIEHDVERDQQAKARDGVPNKPRDGESSTGRKASAEPRVEVGKPDTDMLRNAEEAEQLRKRYLSAHEKGYVFEKDKYYLRDEARSLAFTDTGKKLITQLNDPDIARSMVALAATKGWTAVQLKGTDEFKREAWLEASLRGMQVRGFTPKAVDLARLKELRSERGVRSENTVAHEPARTRSREPHIANQSDTRSDPELRLSRKETVMVEAMTAIMRGRGDSQAAIDRAVTMAKDRFHSDRAHVGKIVDQGRAPYEHDKKNDVSYFVTLATGAGNRTVWGKDLERALKESGATKGSEVVLNYQGRKAVEVTTQERDAAGNVVGSKTIQTHRNEWSAINLESFRESTRASVRAVAAKSAVEPKVRVYDRSAPPAKPRPTPAPTLTKIAERTRG